MCSASRLDVTAQPIASIREMVGDVWGDTDKREQLDDQRVAGNECENVSADH